MPLTNLLEDAIHRLDGKHLLGVDASVSVRLPGTQDMLLGTPGQTPIRVSLASSEKTAHAWHAAAYRARADIGAIALGGGFYGRSLGDFGGDLPQVFDEQARHLGRAALPLTDLADDPEASARRCLMTGGNAWICGHAVLVFGSTTQRLVLNAELLEKCAKAYVLATATGAPVHTLPWWVCHIANGRLKKDQRRASERFAQGLLPDEVKGY
jgi:ribulose-5-phosphate 4-epimerase/fuculose-1-phosphate aldolase